MLFVLAGSDWPVLLLFDCKKESAQEIDLCL